METIAALAGLVSFFAFFVFLFKYFKAKKANDPEKPASMYRKRVLICLAVFIVAMIVTPNKKKTGKEDGPSAGSTAEIAATTESAEAAETDNKEHHIYDNVEMIDITNGPGTKVIGQCSLVRAVSDEITDEVLDDWYFNYVKKNSDCSWHVILYTDKEGYGVYSGEAGLVMKDTKINEKYQVSSDEGLAYFEKDGHLVLDDNSVENDEEVNAEETENAAELDTASDESDKPETEADGEEKSPLENATEMGHWWFSNINWDSVFKYKHEIHYIVDYKCIETPDEFSEYGEYVGIAGADLQNGFGAEFSSHVYIFMDGNGVAQHVFYDEADGQSIELPMDNISMNF